MSATVLGGPRSWQVDRDDFGYRTYKVRWMVQAAKTDSPATVMSASGLPRIGDSFNISGFSGYDQWAWCRPEMTVRIANTPEGDPVQHYIVENTFSNKIRWRCSDLSYGNPLLEPMKISGTFGREQKQMPYDKDGNYLVYSSGIPITGTAMTRDFAKPIVRIQQNVSSLGLSTFSAMINTLNDRPLWGLPARFIKLTNAPWERRIMGMCGYYYTRTFEFEIDNYTFDHNGTKIGWDREIRDMTTMVLRGQWHTNEKHPSGNPDLDYGVFIMDGDIYQTTYDPDEVDVEKGIADAHHVPMGATTRYRDMNNELAPCMLDGHGRPANAKWKWIDRGSVIPKEKGTTGNVALAIIQHFKESNFLLLGVPTTL